jgi:type II secretory pathway component PulJ
MTFRGRHWIMLWLLLFLAVAAVVQARQTAAIQAAGRLRALREERTALEAARSALERDIRQSLSRQTLGGRAERLGLHQPADSEFTVFRLPAREH